MKRRIEGNESIQWNASDSPMQNKSFGVRRLSNIAQGSPRETQNVLDV